MLVVTLTPYNLKVVLSTRKCKLVKFTKHIHLKLFLSVIFMVASKTVTSDRRCACIRNLGSLFITMKRLTFDLCNPTKAQYDQLDFERVTMMISTIFNIHNM